MIDRAVFGSALRWIALGRFSAQLVSWTVTVLVLRLLRPEDYGIAAICGAVIGVVTILSDFALSAGLVQARDLQPEQARGVLGAVLLIAMACTIGVWLAAPLLSRYFDSPQATPMIRVAALQILIGPFSAVPDAMLRRRLRFRALAIVEFVSIVAASALTLALAWNGANAWALVLGPMGGAAVRLALLYAVQPTKLWPSLQFSAARGLIQFGATMAASRVAGYVFSQSDIWIAARALPKTQLGEYSVAMQLAMLPMSKAMSVLNDALYPLVAKMSRDRENTSTPLLAGLRMGMYMAIPVLWGLALVAADLLPLLVGVHWSKAVPIMQVICLLLPLRVINVALATVLQGSGHAGLDLRNTITGALVLPPLFMVGVLHGPLGLAAAWAVGLPIVVAVNLMRSRHALGVGPVVILGASLARPMVLGMVSLAAGICARLACSDGSPNWLALIATALTSQVAYWLLFFAVDRETLRRLLELLGIFRRRVPRRQA